MTKQRPSITSTVMVLDPLIYKLGNAVETCAPLLDRVPGELSLFGTNPPPEADSRAKRQSSITVVKSVVPYRQCSADRISGSR